MRQVKFKEQFSASYKIPHSLQNWIKARDRGIQEMTEQPGYIPCNERIGAFA